MTEAEWLTATSPEMLQVTAMESPAWSFRKETLFSAACCRRVLPILADEELTRALDDFEFKALHPERFPPGAYHQLLGPVVLGRLQPISPEEAYWPPVDPVAGARLQVLYAAGAANQGYCFDVANHAMLAVRLAADSIARRPHPAAVSDDDSAELRAQAGILRDIVGNP